MDGVRLRGGRPRGDRVRRHRQRVRRPAETGDPSVETKAGGDRPPPPSRVLDPRTRFFIPAPNPGAVQQIVDLAKGRKLVDAARITAMEATPHAVWFTDGSPADVKAAVRKTVKAAALLHTVPVLVAYNVPFRDCAQYSAGGAVDTAAYKAWIDGFADGIGSAQVVVILEPDGLGIIPNNERVVPAGSHRRGGNADPGPGRGPRATRYTQINYAVDSSTAKRARARPSTSTARTAPGWASSEAAYRLAQAGVARAAGLLPERRRTTSSTPTTRQFGTLDLVAASALHHHGYAAGGSGRAGAVVGLPDQYVRDRRPVTATGSRPYTARDERRARVDDAYASTSRVTCAGCGPFDTADALRDRHEPQRPGAARRRRRTAPRRTTSRRACWARSTRGNWCNPPGAGLGLRPTANTGVALLDANLWIKVPGESDGSCDIAGGARAWDFTAYNPWGVPLTRRTTSTRCGA